MKKIYFGIFLILGIVLLFSNRSLLLSPEPVTWSERTIISQILIVWGLSGVFIMWFWMLGSHFKWKDVRYPVLWGFLLLFLNLGAALIYFLFVYAPRCYRQHKEIRS